MKFHWAYLIVLVGLISVGCQKESTYADTLVYGHAGTTLYPERWVYPANTLKSIEYAIDVLDADGVEVDVQMTRDSVLVLYHDAYLDDHTKLSGCIQNYDYAQLTGLLVYKSKYELATLDEVMTFCMSRNKSVFLDIKPYNYCDSVLMNVDVFNRSLNRVLEPLTASQRNQIILNTRNQDVLDVITDTSIVISFETENVDLATTIFTSGRADEICISETIATSEIVELFNQANIPFSIFGTKTHAEIRQVMRLNPLRVITDNISYTSKYTN